MLTRHFAAQTERRYGLAKRDFSEDAVAALRDYKWPGNVRELRHQISRAILLSRGLVITVEDLALPQQAAAARDQSGLVMDTSMTLDMAEKQLIENALRLTHNNVSEAARHLGITRMAIRYRMGKHNIRA